MAVLTITLNDGKWFADTHQLTTGSNPSTVSNIYFVWSNIPTVTQYITSISNSNNTITWTTIDSNTGLHYSDGLSEAQVYETIIWTRQC